MPYKTYELTYPDGRTKRTQVRGKLILAVVGRKPGGQWFVLSWNSRTDNAYRVKFHAQKIFEVSEAQIVSVKEVVDASPAA